MSKLFFYFSSLILPMSNIHCNTPSSSGYKTLVNKIFFTTNVFKNDNLLDNLIENDYLDYNDTAIGQWNLNQTIFSDDGENAVTVTHTFRFTKNPINEVPIEYGKIELRINETSKSNTILSLTSYIYFASKEKALIFYNTLHEMFKPVSKSVETDKFIDNKLMTAYTDVDEKIKTKNAIITIDTLLPGNINRISISLQ